MEMDFILSYVRNLIGYGGEENARTTGFKRDRTEDESSFDEDLPTQKRLRSLQNTNFPDIMSVKDDRKTSEKSKVRYVPIQVEAGHPSTSTPNLGDEKNSRVRTVPYKFLDISGNTAKSRKPRLHTPVRPVIHEVIDEDDDDDQEVTLIESQPETSKRLTKQLYVKVDDNEENEPEDIIFVEKISPPPPVQPYKFFKTVRSETKSNRQGERSPQYYRLLSNRKIDDEGQSVSPKLYSKFKAPVGITKGYRKAPTPVSRWLQPVDRFATNFSQARSKYSNMSSRSAITDLFNLDEKRNYQELIRRVAGTAKPISISKPTEIINLADDSASFRSTQRSQKKALEELRLVEKGINLEKEIGTNKEYDPITVASINSSDSEIEVVPSESSTTSSVRIEPINSLRDSYRDRTITSNDWIRKLDSKYKKKSQETQEKLKDARRENDIISKVNYEQKLAHLEHKLKHELSIPESLIEEPLPTVELPPLTADQENKVKKALGPGPPGQLLIEKFNLRICRRDLQTLSGLNWLNDEVINFYMNLLMQRSEEKKDLPKVYAANTFFYPKLMQSGQAGLRRWTRKVDIFAHDLMAVPVHLGVHWCMSLVDFRSKRVQYLDSMGGRNQACLDKLMQYLRDEHQDKKGKPFDDQGWKAECISKNIPQQMNGSDCGMFSCTFAEFAARDAPYTFSQEHMPYLRRKAALEILQGRLLL